MEEFDKYDIRYYTKPNGIPAKRGYDRFILNRFGIKNFSSKECEEFVNILQKLHPEDESLPILLHGCKEGKFRLRYNRKEEMIEVDIGSVVIGLEDVKRDLSEYR